MTPEELEEKINDIRCATFHMDDAMAIAVIDEYLEETPELLDYHTRDWFYNYC